MPGYDNGIKVTEESHAEVFRYKVMMSPTDFKWYGKKKKKTCVCIMCIKWWRENYDKMLTVDRLGEEYMCVHCTVLSTFL